VDHLPRPTALPLKTLSSRYTHTWLPSLLSSANRAQPYGNRKLPYPIGIVRDPACLNPEPSGLIERIALLVDRVMEGRCRLSHGDYSYELAGKVVKHVRWENLPDYRALQIEFGDGSVLVARMHLSVDEEFELGRFQDGNMTDMKPLAAIPTRLPVKRLEDR
jgi:hypothetical protein